jgi:urease beta subunit
MAVAHTTVLELLGKQVSFNLSILFESNAYLLTYTGTVVEVIISLSGDHQISIGSDFHYLSDLQDFCVN